MMNPQKVHILHVSDSLVYRTFITYNKANIVPVPHILLLFHTPKQRLVN